MNPIRATDLKTAQDDYERLSAFFDQMKAERLPDDPPTTLEERVASWQNIPPIVDIPTWIVEGPQGQVIAHADLEILRLEQNQHLAPFSISVLPEFRRQGLAKRLLQQIVEYSQQEGRSLLVASTNSRIPAGEAFMQRLGAEKALESHTNQLDLLELDPSLLLQWLAQAPQRATGFELGFWDGAYPEEQIQAIAHLQTVMNTAPRGKLQMEDFEFGPQELRHIESILFARGDLRWTAYVREQATGKFAGFTEVVFSPKRPSILKQGGTGVFPEYRNLGLGRWLKAAMLQRVLAELPEARFVRTGNADSNAAMLSINHALGFKPYMAEATWQIPTAQALAHLG